MAIRSVTSMYARLGVGLLPAIFSLLLSVTYVDSKGYGLIVPTKLYT